MDRVFISYSRKDLSFVKQVVADLKKAGLDVWYDVSSIRGGSRWRVEIEKAIKKSLFVLVVLSPDSMTSQWVEREFLFASNLKRKIIPIMYRPCELSLDYLDLNYIDVQDGKYPQNLKELLKALSADDTATDSPASEVKKPPFKLKQEYIIAIIGAVATIIAALLGSPFIGKMLDPVSTPTVTMTVTQAPTSTFTSTPATATPEPSSTPTGFITPSSTPVPATDTLVPTFTPVPVPIGKDWIAGCISILWKTYPPNISTVDKGNGCWKEPLHNFSAENGDLDFLAERRSGPAEIYGLFAPLPESGTVTFTVRLRDLNNADLWMGVFPEPDVTSQGLLMTILHGDVSKRSIVQKDPLTYVTIQGTRVLTQEDGFSISFTFKTLSASSTVNPHVFVWDPISMLSEQKWLFLGYKGLNGRYRIDGTFLNFELK